MILNVAAILMISHFLGCLWFVIGKNDIEGYSSWVEQYSFHDMDWEYQYLTSLHWSITQFTPGSMHVQPQNIAERAFAIAVLVAGMIIFSSIVSSITAATNGLKSMNAAYTKRVVVFRRLCRENHVRQDLLKRILKYSEKFIKPKLSRVSFHDVELMKLLPKAFQIEVTLEMYGKHLVCHPLFNALGERGSACLGDICSVCLNEVILDTKEALFSPGDQAHSMYILTHGLLGYLVVLQNPNYPVAKTGKVE